MPVTNEPSPRRTTLVDLTLDLHARRIGAQNISGSGDQAVGATTGLGTYGDEVSTGGRELYSPEEAALALEAEFIGALEQTIVTPPSYEDLTSNQFAHPAGEGRLFGPAWLENAKETGVWLPFPAHDWLLGKDRVRGEVTRRDFAHTFTEEMMEINEMLERIHVNGASDAQMIRLINDLIAPRSLGLFGDDDSLTEFNTDGISGDKFDGEKSFGAFYSALLYDHGEAIDEQSFHVEGKFSEQIAIGLGEGGKRILETAARNMDLDIYPDPEDHKEDLGVALLRFLNDTQRDRFGWDSEQTERWEAFVQDLQRRAFDDPTGTLNDLQETQRNQQPTDQTS